MQRKTTIYIVATLSIALLYLCPAIGQQLTRTNLPIITITTPSIIPNEPKTNGTMGIIYNGPSTTNSIEDAFNDYDGFVGIELRGQSSLALFPKKSFGLETRDSLGNNANVSLLEMPKENDWVLHGPFSDKSLMRNALAYIIAGKIMTYAPRVRFVELVINKEYWGVYLLTEKIKRDKNRVNIQKLTADSEDITGGYIIKFDKGQSSELGWASPYRPIPNRSTEARFLYHYPTPEDITDPQANYIKGFITEFEDVLNDQNFADPIEGYSKYIDVESFIDYLFVNEISKNVDGYRLSTYMYKDSDAIDGRLKKGPVWDFNLAFGNANYCNGESQIGWGHDFNSICPGDSWVIHFWWQRLLEDPAFRKAIKERWELLRANTLSDEVVIGTIDSLENLLNDNNAQRRNFQRWDALGKWVWPNVFAGSTYQSEVDYLRSWTSSRLAWLDRQFADFTAISEPTTALKEQVTVYPNPSKGAIQFDFTIQNFVTATVSIYNNLGQLVAESSIEETDRPRHFAYRWEGNTSPGIYYYTINNFEGEVFSGSFVVVE